ncbi:ERMES complex [Salix suchowensis]|nr:ERMES complex [Salix suchowensis]
MPPNSPSASQAFPSRPYLSTTRPPRSVSGVSMTSTSRRPTHTVKSPPPTVETTSSFPDLEDFDPTYGLRPEGLPNKSLFRGFSSLFTPNKGLADLAEEPSDTEDGDEEMEPFDVGFYRFLLGAIMSPAGRSFSCERLMSPRLPVYLDLASLPRLYPTGNASFSYFSPESAALRLQRGPGSDAGTAFESSVLPPGFGMRRPLTPDSAETQQSRSSSSGFGHSLETPPSSDPFDPQFSSGEASANPIFIRRAPSARRPRILSSPFLSSSSPPEHPDPKIILKPTANNTIHQLSTLSHSNHTLSPYVRSLEHFTVRSVPPRDAGLAGPSSSGDRQPVKARRKRMYRVGSKKKPAEDTVSPDLEGQMLSRRLPETEEQEPINILIRPIDIYAVENLRVVDLPLALQSVLPLGGRWKYPVWAPEVRSALWIVQQTEIVSKDYNHVLSIRNQHVSSQVMMFGSLLKRLTTSLQEIRRIVNNLLNRFDLPLASAPIDWDPSFIALYTSFATYVDDVYND